MTEREQLHRGAVDIVGSSTEPNTWIYELPNGIRMREVTVNSGKGGSYVEIMHLSDLHFNYQNEQDVREANPTLLSTKKHRLWGSDGEFTIKARKLLEYSKDANQIVITGDVLDYLSHGAIELTYREVWDKYPEAIIAVGNHDFVQNIQGTVEEVLSEEERWQWIERIWKHNPHYYAKVVGDKAMVVQLNNAENRFYAHQVERLRQDLMLAREHGYVVLLFMHEPMVTGNPKDRKARPVLHD